MALRSARLTKAQEMPGTIDEFCLESVGCHPDKFGRPPQIAFGEVHVAALIAAIRAAGHASETNAIH